MLLLSQGFEFSVLISNPLCVFVNSHIWGHIKLALTSRALGPLLYALVDIGLCQVDDMLCSISVSDETRKFLCHISESRLSILGAAKTAILQVAQELQSEQNVLHVKRQGLKSPTCHAPSQRSRLFFYLIYCCILFQAQLVNEILNSILPDSPNLDKHCNLQFPPLTSILIFNYGCLFEN